MLLRRDWLLNKLERTTAMQQRFEFLQTICDKSMMSPMVVGGVGSGSSQKSTDPIPLDKRCSK